MASNFTDRAIAYIKQTLPNGSSSSISLPPEQSPVFGPVFDGFCVAYVVDQENAYHFVQERHLAEGNLDRARLHAIGLTNLKTVIAKRGLRVQPYSAIFAVLLGGDFEASLVFVDELWNQHFRQFVKGEYAIAIPNRDVLSFCDVSSANGIAQLRDLISKIHATGDHPISNKIYVRRNEKWIPYGA